MIYAIEQYYQHQFAHLGKDELADILSKDRITMALILASGSSRKSGVDVATFLALARSAQDFGCLAVYVNFYGRPVSYVIWGYCNRSSDGAASEIWFGKRGAGTDIYLIDLAARDGSVDETIAAWSRSIEGGWLTVRRNDRPRQFRTYQVPRIASFPWRVSNIEGRFTSSKGPGLDHYEAISREMIGQYQIVQSVLETIAADTSGPLDITKAVPLISNLLSVDQCRTLFEDGICKAVLLVALSDAKRWQGKDRADPLTLPFRHYLDGDDIIIAGLYGEDPQKERIQARFLDELGRDGEEKACLPDKLWRLDRSGAIHSSAEFASSHSAGLARLSAR